MRAAFLAGCLLVSLALLDAQTPAVTVQITSPLGRIGVAGTIRIVAQIHAKDTETPLKVRFLVDGKQLGVDEDGPPYAIDWLDDNPLESREIVVEATDSEGNSGKDAITLNAYEFSDTASVSSMLLEVNVQDKKGRFVGGLKPGDFTLRENGDPQKLDLVTPRKCRRCSRCSSTAVKAWHRDGFRPSGSAANLPAPQQEGSRDRRTVLGRPGRRDGPTD
jgi:hypothetical protein